MAEPFEGELRLRGVDEINRDLAKLEDRIEKTMKSGGKATAGQSKELKGLKKELAASTKASSAMSGKTVKLAQDTASLGGAVASVTPAMSSLGTSFSAAGQAAGVLGNSIGPVGVGLGVLVATLPLLIDLFQEFSDESRIISMRLNDFAEALSEVEKKQRGIQQLRELVRGERDLAEAKAAVAAQVEVINELSEQGAASRLVSGGVSRIQREKELLAKLKEGLRVAEAKARAEKVLNAVADETRELEQDRLRVSRDRNRELDRELSLRKSVIEKSIAAAMKQREADERSDAEALARQLGFFQREQEERQKNAESWRRLEEENTRKKRIEEEKRFQIAKQFGAEEARIRQRQIESIGEVSEQATSFAVDTFTILAQGEKSLGEALKETTKSFLAEFAIKNAFQGAEALAIAIGNTPFNPVLASAKFQQAAQHFAIAAAAGGGAAVIPGSGGGGGGGAESEPSSPEGAGGDEGGGTVIVNINSPVPEAQIGRMNRRAEREATRRFSSRA